MRKWKVELSTGQAFIIESDDPGRDLIDKGYVSFSLSEIVPADTARGPHQPGRPLDPERGGGGQGAGHLHQERL